MILLTRGDLLGYKTKRYRSQTKLWTFSIKMIPVLSERLENSPKRYSAKVGKRKELQSMMKVRRRWTSGASVSRFDIRYHPLLTISTGQWVVIGILSYCTLFWCLYRAVVILILRGSGLTASRSRRLLVRGQHKSTSWNDIQSSDSHVVPRSNTSGLRR